VPSCCVVQGAGRGAKSGGGTLELLFHALQKQREKDAGITQKLIMEVEVREEQHSLDLLGGECK
jgi:hypothetical protein